MADTFDAAQRGTLEYLDGNLRAWVAMVLATALYTIALSVDASWLAAAPNGPFQAANVGVSLVEHLILMVIAGVLAVTTTRRGWRTISQSDASEAA